MQTRSSDENSVCLFVHPSVCQTRDLWQNKRMIVQIFIPYEILGQPAPVGEIFTRYSLVVPQRQHLAKSLFNTNRKSTTRFRMSLRWTLYVVSKPPKSASKPQKGRFPCKIALCLKKVCYKVSLCENCQWQSCKAFVGSSIRAKMTGGDVPFYVIIWRILTYRLRNADFQSIFARSASAVTASEKKLS